MKLSDLRKLAIRRQVQFRFTLSNGMECRMDKHGIAHVPGIKAPASFSLEDELSQAAEFWLEPAAAGLKPESLSRLELEQMCGAQSPEPAHQEHDD
jgi:hypothetical protein